MSKNPEDFSLGMTCTDKGAVMFLQTSIRTTQECDRVIECLRNVRGSLSSHRQAVAGDFGIEEPKRTYADSVCAFLGPVRTDVGEN